MLAYMHLMDFKFSTYCWPVHCMALNAFKGAVNLKDSVLDSTWNLKPVVIEEVKEW
jgi:hypothetical protein